MATAEKVPRGFRSPEVAEMGKLHLRGNIAPSAWCQHITNKRGNADWTAIHILAEIVGWWRPPKETPEGKLPKPRFSGRARHTEDDRLVMECPYDDLAREFNISCRMAKRAVRKLEDEGFLEVYQLSIRVGGQVLNNVIHVRPVAAAIDRITPSPGQEEIPFRPSTDSGQDEAGEKPSENAETSAGEPADSSGDAKKGTAAEEETDPYEEAASSVIPATEVLEAEGLGHLLPTLEERAEMTTAPQEMATAGATPAQNAPPSPPTKWGEGPPTKTGQGPPTFQGEAPPTQEGDVRANCSTSSNLAKSSAAGGSGNPNRDRTPPPPEEGAERRIGSQKMKTLRRAYSHATDRLNADDNQPAVVAEFVKRVIGPEGLPHSDDGKVRFGFIGKVIKEVGGAKLVLYRLSQHLAGQRTEIPIDDVFAYVLGAYGRGGKNKSLALRRREMRQKRKEEREQKRKASPEAKETPEAPGKAAEEAPDERSANEGGETPPADKDSVSDIVDSVIRDIEEKEDGNRPSRAHRLRSKFWGEDSNADD